ncbi:MAG: DUF2933 domain-containing protein [Chloroflexi bacterium]|nr:DUF2933 domain-containing protein [Chloroflexota bacterium]
MTTWRLYQQLPQVADNSIRSDVLWRSTEVEYFLSLLPLLACPIGMGLMMWFMMRMNNHQSMGSSELPTSNPVSPPLATASGDRLAQLRAHLGEVQAQQAAIAAQITRLTPEVQPAPPQAVTPEGAAGREDHGTTLRRPQA